MSKIMIEKPRMRWLFGGIGFHNSESTMSALMNEKFMNEIALKSFREISPTFSRVFTGYADWTREAMDSFADYYDKTFRDAKTLLYIVPGRMPMPDEEFDIHEYAEKVAENLEYLINVRKCTKIRYYCATNELSCGNTYAYLANHLDLLKEIHTELYRAFRRHGLDIGLLATDCSGVRNFGQIDWATENMDEITESYCAHLYNYDYPPSDPKGYDYYIESFSKPVEAARKKEKRFILGEYGINCPGKWDNGMPMGNDSAYPVDRPEEEGIYALALVEMSLACINSGCFAGCFWTMLDYPDPIIRENGDSEEEKAIYDASRFSGHGMSYRYNKNGLIKWCDDENDYSSRASLYTMGYMAKLFKKGSRVLKCSWDNENIRCGAVTNADGSVSIAIVNRGKDTDKAEISLEHDCKKPLRKYVYEANNIPYNDFCDLQAYSGKISAKSGNIKITLSPESVIFLTTDYTDRKPSEILSLKKKGKTLSWKKCEDAEHCYYRVFASDKEDFIPSYENQIASTVAECITLKKNLPFYKVLSVDRWGNTR